MYSRVKIMGHPLHAMLVGFPVTLYAATFVSFLVAGLTGDSFWFQVGIAANVAGVVMALIAAIPGFLDWYLGIPGGSAAARTGTNHMRLNLLALALFAFNAFLYQSYWRTGFVMSVAPALIFTGLGILCTLGAGWLGWTLVQKHHVGVDLTLVQARDEEERLRRAA